MISSFGHISWLANLSFLYSVQNSFLPVHCNLTIIPFAHEVHLHFVPASILLNRNCHFLFVLGLVQCHCSGGTLVEKAMSTGTGESIKTQQSKDFFADGSAIATTFIATFCKLERLVSELWEDIQDRVNFVELDARSPDWPVELPSWVASFPLRENSTGRTLCQVSDNSFDIVLMAWALILHVTDVTVWYQV
jgi:hypothetical protein